MKDIILDWYEEYKTFMCLKSDSLPQINPIMKSDLNKKIFAYINNDEIGYDIINLYYNYKLLSGCHINYQKSILFHEFTHILDGVKLLESYDNKNFVAIMATYSEYHASQIELACNIGYKNIHLLNKMNLSKTIVVNKNEKIEANNEYTIPLSLALLISEAEKSSFLNLTEIEYFSKYKKFESNTMYYLGKKNFCKKVSSVKEPDLTKKFYKNFYPYIHNIEECIINNKFNLLFDSRHKLWEEYISYFPFYKIMELSKYLQSI